MNSNVLKISDPQIQTSSVADSGMADAGMSDDMWMIQAIIQPFKLDQVTLALESMPWFGGITVIECRGFGREKVADVGIEHVVRSDQGDVVDFTAKLLLEIAVAGRDRADAVIEALANAAHTGHRGDGKIFAWPLTRAVRVRTMDEGNAAL